MAGPCGEGPAARAAIVTVVLAWQGGIEPLCTCWPAWIGHVLCSVRGARFTCVEACAEGCAKNAYSHAARECGD